MIFRHHRRLVVQKSGGIAKYYLPVISASVTHSYPFTIPTATIEVLSGDGLYDYIADVDFDDILRLQVSNTYSDNEKIVWQDLFQGRIINQRSQWGTNSTATILGIGHADEVRYRNIASAYSTAAIDAGTIVKTWNYVLHRISVTSPMATTFSMPYSVGADKKTVKDVFEDVESISGYTYFFDTKPTYDHALNLSSVVVEFNRFPIAVNQKYMVTQSSPRVHSVNFTVSGDELYNELYWYGATPTGGAQYKGGSQDDDSGHKYNYRTLVGADNSFNSNAICGMYAVGRLPYTKQLKVTGTVTLEGTPDVRICDYVHIQIGDIDVQGASLNAYMHVGAFTHNLGNSDFTTTLRFGSSKNNLTDYIAEFKNKNRIISNAFIS